MDHYNKINNIHNIQAERKLSFAEISAIYQEKLKAKLMQIDEIISEDIDEKLQRFIAAEEANYPHLFNTAEKKAFIINHVKIIFLVRKII